MTANPILALGTCLVIATLWIAPQHVAAQDDAVAETAEAATEEGLGLSQGKFCLQIIHEVKAERLFEGPVTGAAAAEKLASIGLAPEGGWQPDQDLTRGALESAYAGLLTSLPADDDGEDAAEEAVEGEQEDAPADASSGEDLSDMTVTELIAKIIEAVNKALALVSQERQPLSPTGASWELPNVYR